MPMTVKQHRGSEEQQDSTGKRNACRQMLFTEEITENAAAPDQKNTDALEIIYHGNKRQQIGEQHNRRKKSVVGKCIDILSAAKFRCQIGK